MTKLRIKDYDKKLYENLKSYNVPVFIVRTWIDQDIINNLDDNDIDEETTLSEIR